MNQPCIVFDMDGVLIDSERIVLASWEAIGPRYGVENPADFCRSCMGTTPQKTAEKLYAAYGAAFPYDDFVAERRKFYYDTVEQFGFPIKEHVRDAIEGLHAMGCTLAVASSTRESLVREELDAVGILSYFSVVIGGDRLKRSKPEPDIYLLACETLGVDPSATYAVEDSYNGVLAAHRAGMIPIMVPDQLPPNDEMHRLCRYIFDDLGALYRHFAQRNQ